MQKIRILSIRLSIWGMLLVALMTIGSQFWEWSTLQEVSSLVSSVTFLALANFGISWSRVGSDIAPRSELLAAKQAGLDLFLASILALISQALIWAAKPLSAGFAYLVPGLMALHLLILAFAWIMAWFPLSQMLRLIQNPDRRP